MEEQEQQPQMPPDMILAAISEHPNLATELDDRMLMQIGVDAVDHYKIDLDSMSDWRQRMERGLDLAAMVKEDKSYPFEGAANVKYPLVTTAALQFNARAYPAIVASDAIVKCKTFGNDPTGAKAARADRVAAHMSYDLATNVEEWESETDKLLVQLPVVGTMIRKVWFDPVEGRKRCRVVDPAKFVVNNNVKVLADAPRCSEEIDLYPYEISERVASGQFADNDYIEDASEDDQRPECFIEQHCRLDLDEDGYPEPYIVTVHKRTMKVARIIADFEMSDVRMAQGGVLGIKRGTYFIDYEFLPSMDGGFWGTGLGLLLGDVSDTINSIINMMMDAGHMASLGGGFIGSEFRIRGGSQRFRPGEWKTPNATGGDIRSSVVPMTFPGPDATLFQLLGLLIDAGKEVASVKDIMTGDTGSKNMTATTTLALIEQGMMVFTAAYKRIFRSLKKEFRLFARINAATVSAEEYSAFHDIVDPQTGQPVMLDPRRDYALNDMDIQPVADPRSVTKMQEVAKAEVVMQMAGQGLVDPGEASQRILQAMSIPDTEALVPQPDPMQQKMAQMQGIAAEADLALKRIAVEQALADVRETKSKTIKNVADAEATAAGVELDERKQMLEAIKAGIDAALRAGTEGLAGTSGNGGNPQAAGMVAPNAGAVMQGGVFPGQPMDGGGQVVAYPRPGTFGGLV